ncbi:helix-turn-helix transcriptional regulator [Asticcacaulis solisilvae]|uniref:helix-turn-helix transcriptional regulator n=1 Tax=Asticcacaulis solisilvae TaxID=1217274 RepID=UPI003FD7908F
MDADLIDRIYECSFVPELWPGVLDELAGIADSRGGLLFSARDKVLNWTSSEGLEDIFQAYVADGWFRRCSRRLCLFGSQHPAFHVEHDFWTEEQIDANPIYRDFFRPAGLGWSAGTGLPMPTGDNIVFSVERAYDRGPIEKPYVDRLNALRPHLARAAFVAARLGLQRAAGANDTLNLLGLPTLLVDAGGAVIAANGLVDDLADYATWRAGDRIALTDPQAEAMLSRTLDALQIHGAGLVHSFPVRDPDGRPAMVAHIVPISRSAHDIFARSYALVVLTPVAARTAPPVELLRSLFDLTPSEARVARSLAAGESLEEIAEQGGVALTTVRTQLRQVMEKTGTTRQAEIVALLTGVSIQR